jgi:hypothetical protein
MAQRSSKVSKPAAIIDLDNCVSNDRWRLHLIQPHHPKPNDRFWEYHEACYMDIHDNRLVVADLSYRYRLLVFTSRPEAVRKKTEEWLAKWKIPHDLLYMRPDDNHMTSVEMKKLMLSWLPADYVVEHAIDDRHDILDMYRSQGIPSTQRVYIYEPEMVHP